MSENDHRDLIERLASCHGGDTEQDQDCFEASEIIAHLDGILRKITAWYDAYPRPVFIEPTKEQWLRVHHLLNKAGRCSLADISASRRKHVLDGIGKIINKEYPSKEKEIVSSESND